MSISQYPDTATLNHTYLRMSDNRYSGGGPDRNRDIGGGPHRNRDGPRLHNKPYYQRRGGGDRHSGYRGGGGYHGGGGRGGRGGYRDNRPREVSDDVKAKVALLFNKSFVFTETEEYALPDVETWFTEAPYQVEELQGYKRQLNATKDLLNDKDKTVWHQHTRFTNPAGNIMRTVRRELSAELLTQAWAKFYEMAGKVVPDSPNFTSVHICEAPGGFICSLNHYLKRNNPSCQWRWFGMTLNPYFEGNTSKEMVDDDLFISKTYNHWYFGRDNTGNVMNKENIAALKEKVHAESDSPVLLVTADGSIDCQDNPNEQEATVSHLHYCETVSALTLLAPGGNFLLKGFTLFEHSTLSLTYLLVCVFEKVRVVKPLTSKSGNSETYTLCTGYKGVTPQQLYMLQKYHVMESSQNAFFARSDLPEEFVAKFQRCAQNFMTYQENMISSNIRTFENLAQSEKTELFQTKDYAVEFYRTHACKELGPINPSDRLVKDMLLDGTKLNTTAMIRSDGKKGSNRRMNSQSHSEKLKERSMSWFDRVVLPEIELKSEEGSQNVGDKMMAKMGFSAGQGLGRSGTGMQQPIEVKQLEEGVGLGYEALPANSAVVSSSSAVKWFTPPASSLELCLKPVSGRILTCVTNSRFLSVDTLEKLVEAERESTVLRRNDLSDLAKSVHPYYSLSSVPEAYNIVDIQLGYLNKLTAFAAPDMCCADLSTDNKFSSYLAKQCSHNTKLKCRVGSIPELDPDEASKLNLLTFDSTSKHSMLSALYLILRHMVPGGNSILHCNRLHDRFTVSIVYFLSRFFKTCAIVKTKVCCPHTPDVFVVAKSYHATDILLRDSVKSCLDWLEKEQGSGRDVLEILPISHLFQPDFYRFISGPSERVSLDAVDTIIDLEKMNHSGSFPSGKSNRFIIECVNDSSQMH